MAKYPIKMLKDEDNVPFVPLVGTDAIVDPSGTTLQEKLNVKLEKDNIIAGDNVTITEEDGNLTISTSGKGTLIDNLDTDESGLGGLDAHQGKVLKEMIPAIANNLTTIDATQTLSAYQGYILNNRVVPKGGDEGQVLKKSADGDWQLEWGDAADPNAISGDGSIKKIISLTWAEYNELEEIDENTEYHIIDINCDYVNNLQNYSFDEQKIGTWVNNKPLYQKTIYISSLPAASTQIEYPHHITDVDIIWIDASGSFIINGGEYDPIIWPHPSNVRTGDWTANNGITVDAAKTETVRINVGPQSRTSASAYITFKYTKTTD